MYYKNIAEALLAILAGETLDAEFPNGCLAGLADDNEAEHGDTWMFSQDHFERDVSRKDMAFMLVVAEGMKE